MKITEPFVIFIIVFVGFFIWLFYDLNTHFLRVRKKKDLSTGLIDLFISEKDNLNTIGHGGWLKISPDKAYSIIEEQKKQCSCPVKYSNY